MLKPRWSSMCQSSVGASNLSLQRDVKAIAFGVGFINNSLLTSLAGFANLETVDGNFFISGLDALTDLNDLASLTTVTGFCSVTPQSLLDNAPQNVQEACA